MPVSRGKGALAAVCVALSLGAASSPALAAPQPPEGAFASGVVEPPILGLALHGDVIRRPAGTSAAASALLADSQVIETVGGLRVRVETSRHYEPSREYDEELVGFLDSLVHGHELDRLSVFVAAPGEMAEACGGLAAACYVPDESRIYIVGQRSFGGIPTTYALAHEYGHRIEDFRHNPPFPGGALYWGTKRWASVMHVCQGAVDGEYVPGEEGRRYFVNPGEAFAEAYAWSHFGPGLIEWRWAPSLHPNAAAYAAIRNDILNPWRPLRRERLGRLTGLQPRHTYRLQPKNDGWLRVTLSGESGNDDLGLLNARGELLAVSAKRHSSREHLNYLVCGDRNLRLLVLANNPPSNYTLQYAMP